MKNADSPEQLKRYDLAFISGFDAISPTQGDVIAELKSAALDRSMHPEAWASIEIPVRGAGEPGGGGFVFESFQVDSITAYVSNQSSIRQILEEELKKDAEEWGASAEVDIWAEVKVMQIGLERLRIPTAEQLKNMKESTFPNKSLEEIASRFNRADTRSNFLVKLRVSWDEDHQRWAEFRDDQLVNVTVE